MRDVGRWVDAQESTEVADVLQRHGRVDETLARLAAGERAQERRLELHDSTYEEELALMREEVAGSDDAPQDWVMHDVKSWPMEMITDLAERVDQRLDHRILAEFATEAVT